jgi:hypothetical protein
LLIWLQLPVLCTVTKSVPCKQSWVLISFSNRQLRCGSLSDQKQRISLYELLLTNVLLIIASIRVFYWKPIYICFWLSMNTVLKHTIAYHTTPSRTAYNGSSGVCIWSARPRRVCWQDESLTTAPVSEKIPRHFFQDWSSIHRSASIQWNFRKWLYV